MKIPRLIAFDLDGTLTESKQRMSAAMGDLLAQLLQRMPVAVMSGGSWRQFQNQFLVGFPPEAPLDKLYLFPTSAAMCLVHRGDRWLPQYDKSFSPEEKKKIMDAFSAAFAEIHFVQPDKTWGPQFEDRDAQITFSALGQQAPLMEKESWDPTRAKRLPLAEVLKRRLPNLSIGVNAMTSIDVTAHGVNKAYGIHRLSELTGIDIEDMLYVGDALEEGGNDAVVLETGISTHAVFGPEETAALIEGLLARAPVVSLSA